MAWLLRGTVVTLLLFLPSAAWSQSAPTESLDSVLSRASSEIARSAYESAVGILTEAKAAWPSSPRPGQALGDLFYNKGLHSLALAEYQEAEGKGAEDFATLTQISRCYGKLNQERKSIEYLTRILEEYPDSSDTIDDLGWMYFKTHQLDKGEQVLLEGITKLGMQRGMAMTLGTVYSDMNLYDKSREYYLQSVNSAVREGDHTFASVAYYNLSLLEHAFFHWNSALAYTDDALAMEDRPSGHLGRAELYQSRMDFTAAEGEVQAAIARDTTPLSRVNLALLYRKFGRLELARRYAEEAMATRDLSWLLNFGIDVTRYYKDLHDLLADTFRGLAQQEAHRPTTGIFDRAAAFFTSARYSITALYHRERFRLYSLQAGKDYLAEGEAEDAAFEFFRANQPYREVALKYLRTGRSLETAHTPHTAVYYTLEEGRETGSSALLEQAIRGFDTFWEKEPIADALEALIPLLRAPRDQDRRRDAIAELYAINPGALPQAAIGLPLAVQFSGSGWNAREKRLVMRFLTRSGSECVEGTSAALRFSLRLARTADGKVSWSATDTGTHRSLASGSVSPGVKVKRAAAAVVAAVLEDLYGVH